MNKTLLRWTLPLAAVAAAAQAARTLAERIAEKLELTPDALLAQEGEVSPNEIADLEPKLERLVRDREAMGPVNLRAEEELTEIDAQREKMIAERDDLAGRGVERHAGGGVGEVVGHRHATGSRVASKRSLSAAAGTGVG